MHKSKKTYPTYRAALKNALHASKKRGTPLRIYPCAECQGFHLTKQGVKGAYRATPAGAYYRIRG